MIKNKHERSVCCSLTKWRNVFKQCGLGLKIAELGDLHFSIHTLQLGCQKKKTP